MPTSQSFWDAAAPMIAATEKHPFLVAMVDGTLTKGSFQHYAVQDAMYLRDFADCLRRLARNPGLSDADSKRLDGFAKSTEEFEMDLHDSFFTKWNISAEGSEQMPNCLLYTSYMKRIVVTKSHAQGLAVMLPCYWVYMHIGQCMLNLRDDLGDSVKRPPEFDAWIDMYAGEGFENSVKAYIAMVDDVCESVTTEEFDEMKYHFVMSCKLEYMFWDQAFHMMKWPAIGGL